MRRKLATYFPLAVLAVGLALGMLAAVMALLPGTSGQVQAATQQVVVGNPQISLGSASDPGGGDASPATLQIDLSDDGTTTITVATSGVSPGGGTGGILSDPQAGSTHVQFDVNDTESLTSQLGQQNVWSVTDNTIAIAGSVLRMPTSLQSACSQANIDVSHGNVTKALYFRHEGVLGGVGAPPQLACNVCKGGMASSLTDDSFARLTGTKGVSPDGLPSGVRSWLR